MDVKSGYGVQLKEFKAPKADPAKVAEESAGAQPTSYNCSAGRAQNSGQHCLRFRNLAFLPSRLPASPRDAR